MSRLLGRISRLEQRYGDCPTCKDRSALIEMVTPSGRRVLGHDVDGGPCPGCGQQRQVISVLWSFDPFPPDEAQEPSRPGPLQCEAGEA